MNNIPNRIQYKSLECGEAAFTFIAVSTKKIQTQLWRNVRESTFLRSYDSLILMSHCTRETIDLAQQTTPNFYCHHQLAFSEQSSKRKVSTNFIELIGRKFALTQIAMKISYKFSKHCKKRCFKKRKKGFSICNQQRTLPNRLLHTHKPLHKPPYIPQISLFQGFIRCLSNPFIVCFVFRTFKVPLSPFYPVTPHRRRMFCKAEAIFNQRLRIDDFIQKKKQIILKRNS